MKVYPIEFIVQFADWFERKYKRSPRDVLLAVVSVIVLGVFAFLVTLVRR